MGSKGLKSVIMCVLILGIILEVEGKSCCMSTLARTCYKLCRLNFQPPICAITCDCIIIKHHKCPRAYPYLNLLPNSSAPNATEYCKLGCVSSVCDTMNNAPDVAGKETKINMESCRDACDRFCNGDARFASVAA
ncbi:thionin BTH7-like [Panicum virgatum]|uniref:Acidic protein n=1 Tax=Panicum virgatum TaxID=38727 RepID=A0A8T0PXH9_PANVG|nr:thionin BTH7-like [Panicum virgatum]KAG2566370.1 hypothetical protein PVAP13_7NG195800 [Panicum virgatum]